MNIFITAICHIWKLLRWVNLKSYHHKKKNSFHFLIFYLYEMMDVHQTYCGNGFVIHSVVVLESLSHVRLFATPWTAARQASLAFAISWSLLTLMSTELVMPSHHPILCHPLLPCSNLLSWGVALYTLSLHSAICQLYPYKTGREKVHWCLLWQVHEGSNWKWPERAWGDFGGLAVFRLLHWILITQECTSQKLEAAHLKIGEIFCRYVTHWWKAPKN